MGFGEAIKTCFSKYIEFSGRARRAEFWWLRLFIFLVSILTNLLDSAQSLGILSMLFDLAILLPSLGVTIRRQHDVNRPGFYILAPSAALMLLVPLTNKDTAGPNRFDADPLGWQARRKYASALRALSQQTIYGRRAIFWSRVRKCYRPGMSS